MAVDVTASFVEIMLNDAYLNPETLAPRSDHELRLMYAMAVVRLVNGIVVAATVVPFETAVVHLKNFSGGQYVLKGIEEWAPCGSPYRVLKTRKV